MIKHIYKPIYNAGKTMPYTIPQITIFIGGINNSQMGGVLLFYPH